MQYSKLVEVYEALSETGARLDKTEVIADCLKESETSILPKVVLLLQGSVFPAWSEKEIGIANLLMIKIITNSTGFSIEHINKLFNKLGDSGLVIEELTKKKKQRTLFQKSLTVTKVFENMQKIADIEGKGSQERKFKLVSELLSSAKPKEAKYIVRTILGDLRIGVARGVMRDAVAKAFFVDTVWIEKNVINIIKRMKNKSLLVEKDLIDKLVSKNKIKKNDLDSFKRTNKITEKTLEEIEKVELWKNKSKIDLILLSDDKLGNKMKKKTLGTVEWAWFLCSDYGKVAKIAKEYGLNGLENIKLEIGKPVHVLLAEKSPSLEDAVKSYEKIGVEVKYDGARVQIHKKDNNIWLFTRRLENVTTQFPDIVKLSKEYLNADNCIVEGEFLGIDTKTGRPLPFQSLSQRIHRKYDIDQMVKEIPIQVNLFDIIFLNGKTLFKETLSSRRKELEKILKPLKGKFQVAEQLITKDLKTINDFYQKALKAGQEGIMVKNLDATYQPGRRVSGGWLKLKPVMETLDLVIIGAQWGTGKRAGWLGSFILGCLDSGTGKFLECGMIGTGIKEKEKEGVTFKYLTELLKPYILKEKGNMVKIKPKVVVEVSYEEIQKSPNYDSGYALRFPRVKRIREDKSPDDSDSILRVGKLYKLQTKKCI